MSQQIEPFDAEPGSSYVSDPLGDIPPDAFQKLLDYGWPGNVRELQNALEYAVVLARQNVIGIKELPAEVQLPAALQKTERNNHPQGGKRGHDVASIQRRRH